MKRLWPGIIIVISFMILNGCVSVTTVETARNFIAYDNGTVLDTRTNLMWAAKDNGSDINWANAKSYCENYRGDGYTDWRMPTQNELSGLYASGAHKNEVKITGWIWVSEGADTSFDFGDGKRAWSDPSDGDNNRALPVRSTK